jgi:hypothetical protein
MVFHNFNLIIFGGQANTLLNDLHEYDIIAQTWTKLASSSNEWLPAPRYGHTATLWKDKMFIFGGCDNNGFCSSDLFTFDIVARRWLPVQHFLMIEERYHHTAELYSDSGLLYIIGGCNKRQALSTVFEINLNNFSVRKCESLPQARYGHVSCIKDGNIYVYGGSDFVHDLTGGAMLLDGGEWYATQTTPFSDNYVHACIVSSSTGELVIGGTTMIAPQTTKVEIQYADELGDAILVIMMYLPVTDLVSVIQTSKSWDFAKYAKRMFSHYL